MTAWQALEADFKQVFVDDAKHEQVQDELKKLKMKDSNVDEYVDTLQLLRHRAGMSLDDPSSLSRFARGLPKSLADARIDINSSENFEQWANAAHANIRIGLENKPSTRIPRPRRVDLNKVQTVANSSGADRIKVPNHAFHRGTQIR
jgi:hypothetical protein